MVSRVTHRGELKGELVHWLTEPLPPTGKRMEIDGIWIFKVADGKRLRAETRGVADSLGLLRQLGAVTTPNDSTSV